MNRARLTRTAAVVALAAAVCAWPGAAGAWVTHENGTGSQLRDPGAWAAPPTGQQCLTAGTNTSQLPVPGCNYPIPDAAGAGALSLASSTDENRAGWVAGALMLKQAIPVTEGMDLTFKGTMWGAPSAQHGDGIAVILQDGDLPIDWGTSFNRDESSYLGYLPRQSSTPDGLPNALAGIAFDSFGLFLASTDAANTCNDPRPWGDYSLSGRVSVRGPGNHTSGYCVDSWNPTPMTFTGANRAAATHSYQVLVPPQPAIANKDLIVKVDGVTELDVPLTSLVSTGYTGPNITTVHSYRIGFASNTGHNYDHNEIYDVNVRPAAALMLTQKTREPTFSHVGQVTHYRFLLTNIGTMPLHNLHVDYHRGGTFNKHDLHCPRIWLQPGQTVACPAWHRVTVLEMKGKRVRDTMYAWGFTSDRRDVRAPSHGGTMKYKDADGRMFGHHLR